MLTLKNFEKQVNATILQRAKKYYQNGSVIELEETEENSWQAEVTGSDIYSVEIWLNKKGTISEWDCTCPYDGDICKHVVAVLFVIRNESQNEPSDLPKAGKRNKFEDLLKKIKPDELHKFISGYALKSKDFRTDFEIYFADKDEGIDISKKYTDLIKRIVRKHSDHGFVHYRDSFGLSKEVNKLLETGYDLIKKNSYREAFLMAKPVLKEMVEVASCCDDSNGNIGDTIDNVIRLIASVTNERKVANELKENIFDFLSMELGSKTYFDYGDFGYELFDIFQKLAVSLGHAERFLNFIDAQIPKLQGEYESFLRDFFHTQKIAFLKATGKTDAVKALVHQNLDIVEVRLGEVEKAIAHKDYTEAKRLITGGIKIAEAKKHPGTVAQWQEVLLRIAVLENDIETVRYYTKLFAFDRWFYKEYYKQWKQTFSAAEWKEVIEKYISERIDKITKAHDKNKGKLWYSPDPPLLNELAPIYIEEGYWDRLLELVKKESELNIILNYHDHLAKRYAGEMTEIYQRAFQLKGDNANSRSEYADLVRKMKKVMKDIPDGKGKILAVARKLKEKYPRRPAMIDELNKIV